MYKLIAFNEVAENFSVHFALGISPYFDRCKSHETGMLYFITHKFVRYLCLNCGYERTEPLENFVCRRYKPAGLEIPKKLMQ